MFANAGMNQFKDVFLGQGTRPYRRAADTQKCIRAGGKHNDLEDVGKDTYHHTFFEMLGNWSFGDYFKREAIAWAWELLTKVWGLPVDRLHATCFAGDEAEGLQPDEEAKTLWREVTSIDPRNIHAGDKKDNFWEMGATGPCGPCTEIHIDLTPDGSGHGLVNAGSPLVIELWNLVFIQFNRAEDGRLSPLPAKHVDTGMGLERVVMVLQGKKSNYDSDLMAPILEQIQKVTGAKPYRGTLPSARPTEAELRDVAYRVVADHLRCLTFAIADGVMPSNEGRGYVIRRILRRAHRYGRQHLGMDGPFIYKLVPFLVDHMGDSFAEIRSESRRVIDVIHEEERAFSRTLDQGIRLFDRAADQAEKAGGGVIAGLDAFKLHDTYGFPVDLTQLMAQERGLSVDLDAYKRLMEEAQAKARSGRQQESADTVDGLVAAAAHSEEAVLQRCRTDEQFKWHADALDTVLVGWFGAAGRFHEDDLTGPEHCALVLRETCFYAEQGGQVGDTGEITAPGARFRVLDTRKIQDAVLHYGELVEGRLRPGQAVRAAVDGRWRSQTKGNHTATHLLNHALRIVLGKEVNQKGSLVHPGRARFDFSHNEPLRAQEVRQVESVVNLQVEHALPVYSELVPRDRATQIHGLRAVFDEKYSDTVRVISVGVPVAELAADPANRAWANYSVELCGGTHVSNTAQIGQFVLVDEEAVARGVRRVVALTGLAAEEARARGRELLEQANRLADVPADNLTARLTEFRQQLAAVTIPLADRMELRQKLDELQQTVIEGHKKRLKEQEKQEAKRVTDVVLDRAAELLESAERIGTTAVVVGEVPGAKPDQLRTAIDWLRQKSPSSAAVLASTSESRVVVVAGLTRDLVGRGLSAVELIREIGPLVGGSGGGRADLAQGGGTRPESIPAALDTARHWLRQRLAR
jgi:alanyl-tRNA synthetase